MNIPTKEQFLESVKNHTVTTLLDNGVYRHLHCTKGSINRHFDIVTYPGHLVISGDMGSYTFKRVDDMFKFFHMDDNDFMKDNVINPHYWGEKLEAVCKQSGYRVHSEETLMKSINDHVDNICADIEAHFEGYDDDEYETVEAFEAAFREEVKDHFKYCDMDEYRFIGNFESNLINGVDFSEDMGDWVESESYSYHYIWCCYAIAWAIGEYDKLKAPEGQEAQS